MANYDCSSCENLREDHPKFTLNGFSDSNCTNLSNNKGLDGTNDNCDDMHDVTDCLVGMMDREVDAYETCDWKTFMHRFIPNVWTALKGIVCWLCGLQCQTDYLFNGASFYFGENVTGVESKIVPGTGVDFGIRQGSSQHTGDVTIVYIAGGLSRLSGSVRFFTESFKDVDGNTKSGNSQWNFEANNYELPNGGELIYELRIKKSEFPQIRRFFDGMAFANGSHHQSVEAKILFFNEGTWANGQHGWCNSDDGTPSEPGYSAGHKVPDGWMYIQLRMFYVHELTVYGVKDGEGNTKQGTDLTPAGYLGVRMKRDGIEC